MDLLTIINFTYNNESYKQIKSEKCNTYNSKNLGQHDINSTFDHLLYIVHFIIGSYRVEFFEDDLIRAFSGSTYRRSLKY